MFAHRIDDSTELRLLQDHHAEELFALVDANRQHLRKWMPWFDSNTTSADSRAFIRSVLEQLSSNRGFSLGVFYQGRLAGMVGLHTLSLANRFVRLGYWLGEEFQGLGLVTKACQVLTDYAFNEMGLNKVEIDPAAENAKSRAIPERLGFRQEGTVRQVEWLYGHFVDHVIYGMLADEWPSAKMQGAGSLPRHLGSASTGA